MVLQFNVNEKLLNTWTMPSVAEPEEAVDLTKPTVLTKCAKMMGHQTISADVAAEVPVPVSAASLESKGNRDSEARRNYALLAESYAEDEAYTRGQRIFYFLPYDAASSGVTKNPTLTKASYGLVHVIKFCQGV